MAVRNAAVVDQVFAGADTLAAVLYPTREGRQEAVRLGRERMAQGRSFAEAFANPVSGPKPGRIA